MQSLVISHLRCLLNHRPSIQRLLSLGAEVSFQINPLKILPNRTLFMWPENNAPEGATSWRERDGRARQHISFWGKLTSQFCPVIDSIWLRSFSLDCDCHLDNWEAKACNYSQATLLSEPGRALLLFLPWLITGEAGQGGSRERGESWIFLHGKCPYRKPQPWRKGQRS